MSTEPDTSANKEPDPATGRAGESNGDAASAAGDEPAAPPEKQIVKGKQTLSQIHISKILDNVLEEENQVEAALPKEEEAVAKAKSSRIAFSVVFDILLGAGLLCAMGGFGMGIFHMYLVHAAQQSINDEKYEAAIVMLRGTPFPQIFNMQGSESAELLNEALYKDAVAKLNTEDPALRPQAIKELQEITAGRHFANAHKLIGERDEPAPVMLQGGTETVESNPDQPTQKTLLEKTVSGEHDGEHHAQTAAPDKSDSN